MIALGWTLLGVAVAAAAYPYVVYPVLLEVLAGFRGRPPPASPDAVASWPTVTITVPVHDEAGQIRELLESILALDYPKDRTQILIVSDASSDGSDAVVAEYADRGVELVRIPRRSGKTRAENAALSRIRGEIVVNTDASVRVRPDAVRLLVAALEDPGVGVASGRDVSVSGVDVRTNEGESRYVGFEMWLREMETRVDGIVGASGCLYAIRSPLHGIPLPGELARDFAAVLNARERGFRAVSVNDAVCHVLRTTSLRREYRRKVRTFTRGMQTLLHKRGLLNPLRHGLFSWMLWSHKVWRWAIPWAALAALAGLSILAGSHAWAAWTLAAGAGVAGLAWLGWFLDDGTRSLPPVLSLPAYAVITVAAAGHAALRALGGRGAAVWEPTRRAGAARSRAEGGGGGSGGLTTPSR